VFVYNEQISDRANPPEGKRHIQRKAEKGAGGRTLDLRTGRNRKSKPSSDFEGEKGSF